MSVAARPLPTLAGGTRVAVAMFAAFAFAYFFSALLRAVTATLAPAFSAELGLSAGDLGLLAGAYFLGFALMQLPLGRALDRFGPRRVLLVFLSLAVLACDLRPGGAFPASPGGTIHADGELIHSDGRFLPAGWPGN